MAHRMVSVNNNITVSSKALSEPDRLATSDSSQSDTFSPTFSGVIVDNRLGDLTISDEGIGFDPKGAVGIQEVIPWTAVQHVVYSSSEHLGIIYFKVGNQVPLIIELPNQHLTDAFNNVMAREAEKRGIHFAKRCFPDNGCRTDRGTFVVEEVKADRGKRALGRPQFS